MKRVFVLLLLTLTMSAGNSLLAESIKGRITAGGKPVAGVVVTDGENFAVSGANGKYLLESEDDAKFIYISSPAGYNSPLEAGVVKFYQPKQKEKKSYDFALEKKASDDKKHGFVVIADPQIYAAKEFPLLSEAAADIRETVGKYDMPFHGIACGDLISHDHNLYPEYVNVMSKTGIPFFNTMGNHDMVVYGPSNETTRGRYEDIFGPSYYSFNAGDIHYVVLNDNFYIGRDYFYIGYLDGQQLEWLKKDLSYVKEGTTVVVALHIPTTEGEQDRKQFSYARAGNSVSNHKALYNILKPFNAHIISGHTHTMANHIIAPNLYEHNIAALSGAWWQGELCTDGTPRGYAIFTAEGGKLNWKYKATGKDESHQMRLYTGEDDKSFGENIVANIWNSDSNWRVELWEEGKLTSKMERFDAYDPAARELYSNKDKLEHKWIYPSVASHFYRAKPLSSSSDIEVIAYDSFGRKYSQKLRSRSHYDVVIIGGGASGTSAGIRSASLGARTLIVEEFEWLGGMLTSAGVSATDGNYKLRGGFWAEFRDSLERHYGGAAALKTGWVSSTLFEPKVGDRIFKNMAARQSRLSVWYRSTLSSLEKSGTGWRLKVSRDGSASEITAAVVIDATEMGDVAKMAGVPYSIGMDSKHITGEYIAPEQENDIIQDLTYVMVLKDYGKDMTIAKPAGYNPTLFYCSTISKKCTNPKEKNRLWSPQMMITYGKLPNNKYMINWPIEGNDFYLNLLELTPAQRQEELKKAKNHSLSFLYYLQTELGFKNLALADDEFPTEDKFPFIPYHRESRRIRGAVTFGLNHIKEPYKQAEKLYRTAIAVGDYPVDHHHTRYSGWENLPDLYFYPVPSYGLPMGTLIPEGTDNLIVAEKSISVTNLVNGTTRLQPVVLQIGEAAGTIAALAVKRETATSAVKVREVQESLLSKGGYLLPYLDLPADHKNFKAIQRIGVTGIIKGIGANKGWENQTWFKTDSLMTVAELADGLKEVYTHADFTGVDDGKVTPENLAVMIARISGKERAEIEKSLATGWKSWGLGEYSSKKELNRLECAVSVDALLNPFAIFDVDLKGNLNTAK